MFGLRFIKVQPTTYLLQYRGGRAVREGPGWRFSITRLPPRW